MDQEQFERILEQITLGNSLKRSLERERCTLTQFHRYRDADPIRMAAHWRAKVAGAESLVEEIVEIADGKDDPQTAKNRIEVRRWIASKLISQVYGDKLQLDVSERIDPAALRAEALSRLAARPGRDLSNVDDAQLVEPARIPATVPTDNRSAGEPAGPQEGMRSVFD